VKASSLAVAASFSADISQSVIFSDVR